MKKNCYIPIVAFFLTLVFADVSLRWTGGLYAASRINGYLLIDLCQESIALSGSGEREKTFFKQLKKTMLYLLDKAGVDYEFAKLYATWIVGAPTFVVFVLIVMILRPRRKKKATTPRRSIQISPQKAIRTRAIDIKQTISTTDKDQVLDFFFRLFKRQVGALAEAATELRLVDSRTTCPNQTYEMRVKLNNEWISRRMSIGLLGQGGGSRSKCFYVIYDSHMVLKIPSNAIPEFSVYRERIKGEAQIVQQLYPRECIVPRMAVILKAVHKIKDSEVVSEEDLEAKYVHLLEVNPDYQEYLKIGSSFAFFMDLARHFFLSTTLEEIHRGNQRLVDEALKQHELLWDQHGFACRYGESLSTVCHELQDAYYRSEGQLRKLVQDAQIIEDIPVFQLKQWFLKHLAGENIDAASEDLPEGLVAHVNRLLNKVIHENWQQVGIYRQSIRNDIKEKRFSRHRIQLENLATNTLALLAWIDEKGLSLRDLKPENLFVAGDPNAYPVFLNDAKKFSIGLIDVETAVVMGSKSTDAIPQPQLAGTPLYATPSHLLSNVLLTQVFPDVRVVLHMQDWYATIAIIYKIITGKNMFSSTALVFPELVKQIKLLDPEGEHLEKEMKFIHQLFWSHAVVEFKEALAMDSDLLERVDVVVPKSMVPDIVEALHNGCDQISSELAKTVSQQSIFIGREKCQFLLDVTVEKIRMMKNKLIHEKVDSSVRKEKQEEAIAILMKIEEQKRCLKRKLEAVSLLKNTEGAIAADQLLEAMFEKVFSVMYLPHWPVLEPIDQNGESDWLEVDITTYQATM